MNNRQLTPHFWLAEVTTSQEAARRDIDNSLPQELMSNVLRTAQGMEDVRKLLGSPIFVSSWYRSKLLNCVIGGTANSQHTKGQAVDFACPGFGTPYEVAKAIRSSLIPFDQLIYEYSWVHVSFVSGLPRRQVLTIVKRGYTNELVNGAAG